MKNIEFFSQDLISFLISPSFEGSLLTIKVCFIIFSLILVGFIIFLFFKSTWFSFRYLYNFVEFFTFQPFRSKKIEKDWKKIKIRLEKGLESEYKLAVIEADKTLDQVLKELRHEGEGLGAKLEKITAFSLPNIEDVKQAHIIRNNIIHDPNYKLSLDQARKVLDIFEQAFKSLDIF